MVNSTGGKDTVADWTVQQSAELYSIDAWGQGHFSINGDGNLTLQTPSGSLDLKTLVDELSHRGLDTPILIRLLDLLEVRVEHLNGCFARAIEQFDYKGSYRGVYPIKVNQQRQVVEQVVKLGQSAAPRSREVARCGKSVWTGARGRLQTGTARGCGRHGHTRCADHL